MTDSDERDLSPAVRRLLKLYNLDARAIPGTGPDGRLRVSDVMAVLGSGTSVASNGASAEASTGARDDPAPTRDRTPELPVTSVFECDLSAVQRDRRLRMEHGELSLTAYYVYAAARALGTVREALRDPDRIDIAVPLPVPGRSLVAVLRDVERMSFADIDCRLRTASREPPGSNRGDEHTFKLYHHGASGSLLVTPTPLAVGETASLGMGRSRRQVVVPSERQESLRVAQLCLVSLSFWPSRLDLHRANALLAALIEQLEMWSVEPEADEISGSGHSTEAIASTT